MRDAARMFRVLALVLLTALLVSACNLGGAPEPTSTPTPTSVATSTATTTATATGTLGIPTPLPLTQVAIPTARVIQATLVNLPPTPINFPATSVAQVPPTFIPVSTPQPVRIVILSPVPGSVVAGNVNVIGTAIHPQFLQYQLEYGPDPNSGELWYPISVSQFPVENGTLGIWNTLGVQDGTYQLRLRVWLRDGTSLLTISNAIRVQNRVSTPVPSPTPSIARPIAAFSQSRTQGFAPLTVRFTSQAAGDIDQYRWIFGDGTSSSDRNPVHTFNNPGVYPVTLTVTGPGGTSNVTSQVLVRRADAPTAAFAANPTQGTAPLRVQFTNQSQGRMTGVIWNFGDGTTSTDQNPTHTYENVGTYNVILTVTGPGGSSIATRQISVTNPVEPPPAAAFAVSERQGTVPLTVRFNNQSTGNITEVVWNFGDGTTSTDRNPTHTYTLPGDFVVTLIASGPGGWSTAQRTIRVQPQPTPTEVVSVPTEVPPPVAIARANPVQGVAPLNVEFRGAGSQNAVNFLWDFGDGRGRSTEPNTRYTYETAGRYNATLTVRGADGRTDSETITIIVNARPTNTPTATPTLAPTNTPLPAPVAIARANPTQGVAPLTVDFRGRGSENAVEFLWDFGDGRGRSTEANTQYTYQTPGRYNATLTVRGADGRTDSETITIIVNAPPTALPTNVPTNTPAPAPVAIARANPTQGVAPLTVEFRGAASQNTAAYFWDFGDERGASTDANTRYTYTTPGTFNAVLTVTGADGQTDSETVTIVVVAPTNTPVPPTNTPVPPTNTPTNTPVPPTNTPTNTPVPPTNTPVPEPVAVANANPTEGLAPLTVEFRGARSENAAAYFWDFGDGRGASTDANTTYTYTTPGTYNATLTVTGADGRTASQTVTINVIAPTSTPTNTPVPPTNTPTNTPVPPTNTPTNTPVPEPVAVANANPTEGTAPLTVEFRGRQSENAVAFFWDFGDGQGASTDANTTYTYTTPGTYNATLTVTGADGRTASQTVTINVVAPTATPAPEPVAVANANPTEGTAPLTVEFRGRQSENAVAYFWDFGDGQGASTDANTTYIYQNPGTYNATLTVTGADGRTASQTVTINVALPPTDTPEPEPVAVANANPTEGTAPLTVEFRGRQSENAVAFFWDFGDGQGASTDANTTYIYQNPGTYNATLTVTGADGRTASQTVTINVVAPTATPAPEPVAEAGANPQDGVAPLTVQFSSEGSQNAVAYFWDFGDGQGASTEPNPSYAYPQPGQYTATLTVTGADGRTASDTVAIAVRPPEQPPQPPTEVAQQPTEASQPPTEGAQPIMTLQGHTARVNAVVWSPDGTRVASAGVDATVIIWDVASGQPIAQLQGHAEQINGLSWSPNGANIASAGSDDQIIIWDVASGQPVAQLQGHTDDVYTVAWNPSGGRFASGSADDTIIIWDAATWQPLASLAAHTDDVLSLAWSPLGDLLVSGGRDNQVLVWQPPAPQPIMQLQGHQRQVQAVVFNPNGSRVASGGNEGVILLWSLPEGQQLGQLEGHQNAVLSLSWNPAGGTLASGSADTSIHIWDVARRETLEVLQAHQAQVTSVAWSPDGTRLASASADNTVLIWQP